MKDVVESTGEALKKYSTVLSRGEDGYDDSKQSNQFWGQWRKCSLPDYYKTPPQISYEEILFSAIVWRNQ